MCAFVVTNPGHAARFDDLPAAAMAGIGRVAVGGEPPGWIDYRRSAASPPPSPRWTHPRASDPLLEYFTSGTTVQAQAGAAHAPATRWATCRRCTGWA
jgi:acetyl-CoA synthetase